MTTKNYRSKIKNMVTNENLSKEYFVSLWLQLKVNSYGYIIEYTTGNSLGHASGVD